MGGTITLKPRTQRPPRHYGKRGSSNFNENNSCRGGNQKFPSDVLDYQDENGDVHLDESMEDSGGGTGCGKEEKENVI